MPQWNRDRAADIASGADPRAIAECPVRTVALLARYDHHVVRACGREAVLISYHLREADASSGAVRYVQVSFAHPAGHPAAPAEVQAVIDELSFAGWYGRTTP